MKSALPKNNFGGLLASILPEIQFDYPINNNLKTALNLSKVDLSLL
jgi:hypothetical protein